jgi:hypothetical protein
MAFQPGSVVRQERISLEGALLGGGFRYESAIMRSE